MINSLLKLPSHVKVGTGELGIQTNKQIFCVGNSESKAAAHESFTLMEIRTLIPR
jgi:hypothetical protein